MCFSCVASAAHFLLYRRKIMENELYKKMYLHLFNAVTDAINEPNHIKRIEIMKQAQIDTEEMYISYCEIIPFNNKE